VRLLHESFLDDFSAWRKLKSLMVCVRAVDADSNWDRGNYILASKRIFIRHGKHMPLLRCTRSTCSSRCLPMRSQMASGSGEPLESDVFMLMIRGAIAWSSRNQLTRRRHGRFSSRLPSWEVNASRGGVYSGYLVAAAVALSSTTAATWRAQTSNDSGEVIKAIVLVTPPH
jgi:hypothetical protein